MCADSLLSLRARESILETPACLGIPGFQEDDAQSVATSRGRPGIQADSQESAAETSQGGCKADAMSRESSPRNTTPRHASRSHSPAAFDWPLSREEKKVRVIQLYDQDARESDRLLRNGDAALVQASAKVEKLRLELERLREVMPEKVQEDRESHLPPNPFGLNKDADGALRKALGEVTAILEGLLPEEEAHVGPVRAKSEGAIQKDKPSTSAMVCPERRRSRQGTPRRVSFADPEPEPEGKVISSEEKVIASEELDEHRNQVVVPERLHAHRDQSRCSAGELDHPRTTKHQSSGAEPETLSQQMLAVAPPLLGSFWPFSSDSSNDPSLPVSNVRRGRERRRRTHGPAGAQQYLVSIVPRTWHDNQV